MCLQLSIGWTGATPLLLCNRPGQGCLFFWCKVAEQDPWQSGIGGFSFFFFLIMVSNKSLVDSYLLTDCNSVIPFPVTSQSLSVCFDQGISIFQESTRSSSRKMKKKKKKSTLFLEVHSHYFSHDLSRGLWGII